MEPVDLPRPVGAPAGAPVPSSAWRWLLAGSAAAVALYAILQLAGPPWERASSILIVLVVLAGLGAIVVGIVRYRPDHQLAWWLIAAGYLFAFIGEVRNRLRPFAPFPSSRDALFLVSYALFIIGFLIMARARISGRRGGEAVLDSLIVIVALMLLTFHFVLFPLVLGPYVESPLVPLAAQAAAVAYLMGDFLLLAVAVLVVAGGPLRPGPVALLVVGVGLMLVDDAVSTAMLVGAAEQLQVAWLLSYALGGAAALHPSMRALTEPAPVQPRRLSLARVALLVVIAVVIPMLVDPLIPPLSPLPTSFLWTGVSLLALLVFARLGGLSLAMNAQVRGYEELLDRTVRAKEQERLQIAADLHDGTIQRLAAMGITAELVRRRLAKGDQEGAGTLLERLGAELGDEVADLRRVLAELRPALLEAMGLASALRAYVDDFERRTGIRCFLRLDAGARLDQARETILYRVVQEMLTNIAKHARARQVWIRLDVVAGATELSIRDDGVGFDATNLETLVDQGHYGLAGARERVELAGGAFRVSSRPGRGTTIMVSLPPSAASGNPISGGPPPAGRAAASSTWRETHGS
jgi:signal transduction histidine kinase